MKSLSLILFYLLHIQQQRVIFDIPSLRDKSIVQIKQILGKPEIDDIPLNYKDVLGSTGDAWFRKDGFALEVIYNPINDKVIQFFMGKDIPDKSYILIEEAGNLTKSKDFILSPAKYGKDPTRYTGIAVNPK